MSADQRAHELKAAVTAYLGLLDAARALFPWVRGLVDEAAGELPEDTPSTAYNWPEGTSSVRGCAYALAGHLGQDVIDGDGSPFTGTADALAVLLRRLNETIPTA